MQFQGGLLQAPLNPLRTDVSRGLPGLSGGTGLLWPHRNSTTEPRFLLSTWVVLLIMASFYVVLYFMLFVCSVAWLFLLGCQYQCK